MANFYIKQLTILGENKTPSSVDFDKGLNIIHGVSDTGKTCVFKCIDFCFGSKNKQPIPQEHGYTKVQLLIETDNGNITLTRIMGKNKVAVSSENPNIATDDYDLLGLSAALIGLIGITDKPKIIKNSRYEKQSLTWRTFLSSFLISEEEVIRELPILVSKETTQKTASLSALLYLVSATDFSKITSIEDKKIREARKRALEAYLHEELKILKERQENIRVEYYKTFDYEAAQKTIANIENEIPQIVEELSAIEQNIKNEIEKSKGSLKQIFVERERLAECELSLNRYDELRSQYIADIKRLGFIVDGENCIGEIAVLESCPLCDNKIKKQSVSSVEAANAELAKITKLLTDLEKTTKIVSAEKSEIEKRISTLIDNHEKIQKQINYELKPKARELELKVREFREYVNANEKFKIIGSFEREKTEKLHELMAKKDEKPDEYSAKEHFPANFEKEMTELFVKVLEACKYENLNAGMFSMKDFDVFVNGMKKENFGKGFRAFLNVALVITMREYLVKFGKFPPRLLIIDSPLLSLKQGVSDLAPESMKSALMEYLIKTQNVGQTIIIENDIPNLNYKDNGVKLHNFTKGKDDGRYGLLADVHN